MKFCDKLIQLRKRNGLSQEELGEKLNVTRQTVSKWELGQLMPETDRLLEISKLFNVDFSLLTNDNIELKLYNGNEHFKNDDLKPRKWLLVVLIFIAIIIIGILGGKLVFDGLFGYKEKINKEEFNQSINIYIGTNSDSQLSSLLDVVITNNKINHNHLITVKHEEDVSTEPNKIKNIKMNLMTDISKKYEVSANYDENGYINEIIIEKYKNYTDANSFNSSFERYSGRQYGLAIKDLLDDVITNNETNQDKIINIKYGSIDTNVPNEIRNLKNTLARMTRYEVILEYDKDGYVNLITIGS